MKQALLFETEDRQGKTHRLLFQPRPKSKDYDYFIDDRSTASEVLDETAMEAKLQHMSRLVTIKFLGVVRNGKVLEREHLPDWVRSLLGLAAPAASPDRKTKKKTKKTTGGKNA